MPYCTSNAVTISSFLKISGKFLFNRSSSVTCPLPVTTIGITPLAFTLQSSSYAPGILSAFGHWLNKSLLYLYILCISSSVASCPRWRIDTILIVPAPVRPSCIYASHSGKSKPKWAIVSCQHFAWFFIESNNTPSISNIAAFSAIRSYPFCSKYFATAVSISLFSILLTLIHELRPARGLVNSQLSTVQQSFPLLPS